VIKIEKPSASVQKWAKNSAYFELKRGNTPKVKT